MAFLMKQLTIVGALVLMISGCQEERPIAEMETPLPSDNSISYPETLEILERELIQLAVLIRLDFPQIEGRSDLEKAIILRDAVYQNVGRGSPGEDYEYGSPVRSYTQSFFEGHQQICGGYSGLYIFMLESMGINTRRIGMWASNNEATAPLDGHVSVEAFIDGRWIAMDPTFNVSLTDDQGRLLSWLEARERYQNGAEVLSTDQGMGMDNNRTLEAYYIGLNQLTRYLTIGPGSPGAEVENHGYDGILHYSDGSTYNFEADYNNWQYRFIGDFTAASNRMMSRLVDGPTEAGR